MTSLLVSNHFLINYQVRVGELKLSNLKEFLETVFKEGYHRTNEGLINFYYLNYRVLLSKDRHDRADLVALSVQTSPKHYVKPNGFKPKISFDKFLLQSRCVFLEL